MIIVAVESKMHSFVFPSGTHILYPNWDETKRVLAATGLPREAGLRADIVESRDTG